MSANDERDADFAKWCAQGEWPTADRWQRALRFIRETEGGDEFLNGLDLPSVAAPAPANYTAEHMVEFAIAAVMADRTQAVALGAREQPDEAFPAPGAVHSNHPMRHYDRTCGACIADRDWEAMDEPPEFDATAATPTASLRQGEAWISCAEKMPLEQRFQRIAVLRSNEDDDDLRLDIVSANFVVSHPDEFTHWLPLPMLPAP